MSVSNGREEFCFADVIHEVLIPFVFDIRFIEEDVRWGPRQWMRVGWWESKNGGEVIDHDIFEFGRSRCEVPVVCYDRIEM